MNSNPYKPPSAATPTADLPPEAPRFPLLSAGPIVGAVVGITHVASMAFVWTIHGYPDFFFRTPDWAFMAAAVMTIGGALFGMAYGGALWFACRSLHLVLRPRIHFWAALLASLLITGIASELALRRILLVSPILILPLIVGCSFTAALVTARRLPNRP